MKRLFLLISLNVAYSTAELLIGLFTGRVGMIEHSSVLNFVDNECLRILLVLAEMHLTPLIICQS